MSDNCFGCPLLGRTKVSGEGNRLINGERDNEGKYEVVAVGIVPAYEEVTQGRPHVGKSGRIIRQVMDQLGYKDYYLTNTILCELPDDISDSDRRLSIEHCTPRLLEEVKDRKPKLAIAFGNVPLRALTGEDYKITEVEGRVVPGIICEVLPISHPAAMLRERLDTFPDFVDALQSGINWLSGNYYFPLIPDVTIVTDYNVGDVLQKIENHGMASIDLETTKKGFYPYHRDPDTIRCISVAVSPNEVSVFPQGWERDNRVKDVLNKVKGIYQNGQFDCGFFWKAGFKTKIYYDTLLAHYQMDERPYAHGLKHLAQKYCGAPDWDAPLKPYLTKKNSSYDNIPDEVLYPYAGFDAVYTWQLYQAFSKEVPIDGKNLYSRLVIPCTNMLVDLRDRGIQIDPRRVLEIDEILDEDLGKSWKELDEMVGHPINPNSPPEVASLIYDELKFPTSPHYGRSTVKGAMALHQPHPIIEKVLECRALRKLRSTYVQSLIEFMDDDFRIYPFLKLFGTITGRLSSEDPSVLNIKRDSRIKNMYIPKPGYKIIEMDQKQMELRVFSVLANDEHLRSLFNQGIDPHGEVQRYLLEKRNIEFSRPKVKAGVFGKLYGRGKESYMREYKMTNEEATDLERAIGSMFPGITGYNNLIKKLVHEQGYVESYFGRKRRFPLITNETKHEIYRMGVNFAPQSTASDINLFCMLYLYENRDRLGIIPLFPVHDANVGEISDVDMIPTIVKEIEDYSKDLMNGAINFVLETKVGDSWGSVKLVE